MLDHEPQPLSPLSLDGWLAQFTTGAAQLPGWALVEGHLRRWNAGEGPTWSCPLSAQETYRHPEAPCRAMDRHTLRARWGKELRWEDLCALVDAADCPPAMLHVPTHLQLLILRARLLAACGVQEGASERQREAVLPLAQVAQAVGLGDQTALGKLFKAHWGLPMRAYRQQTHRAEPLAGDALMAVCVIWNDLPREAQYQIQQVIHSFLPKK